MVADVFTRSNLREMPRLIQALICAIVLLAALPTASAKQDRTEFYFNIAEGNYLIGDTSGARQAIVQILRLDPNHAPALALRARVQLDQGAPEEALKSAEAAIAAAPDHLEHQNLRALILGHMGQRTKALQQLHAVTQVAPSGSDDYAVAQQLSGLMQMAEGKWDSAAQAFKTIYDADSQLSESGRQLATEAYLEKARKAHAHADSQTTLDALDQAIALYSETTGSENLAQRDRLQLLRAKTLAQSGQRAEAVSQPAPSCPQPRSPRGHHHTRLHLHHIREVGCDREPHSTISCTAPTRRHRALSGGPNRPLQRPDRHRPAKFEAALENQTTSSTLRPTLLFYTSLCHERLGRSRESAQQLIEAVDAGFAPRQIPKQLTSEERFYGFNDPTRSFLH